MRRGRFRAVTVTMKKKLLSLILTGVMLLSAPSGAMALEFSSGEPAADEFTDEYLQEYAAASAPVQESAELPEQDLIFTAGEAEEAAAGALHPAAISAAAARLQISFLFISFLFPQMILLTVLL